MIRLAIIGLGVAARNIHLPAYSRLRNQVTVVAGCDIDKAARDRAQKEWNVPAVYEQPGDLLEAVKPDVVAVCTPPSFHHEHTLAALNSGCHVFCEKPLAENLIQVDEIVQTAERCKRTVVVNSQFPCMNIYATSKKMIGSPEFGRLLFLHARQTFFPTEKTEAGWRSTLRRRLCFEFGVHVFELVRFFFEDNPTRVFSHMPLPKLSTQSEPVDILSVEFSDGRAASMVFDRLSHGPERYLDLTLDGEFASIYTAIGGEAQMGIGIHTRERRPFLDLQLTMGAKAVLQKGARSKVIAKDGRNPFASATSTHFQNFIDAIEKGVEPAGSAKDHRNTLALVFAAYESAETGRATEMKDFLARQDGSSTTKG